MHILKYPGSANRIERNIRPMWLLIGSLLAFISYSEAHAQKQTGITQKNSSKTDQTATLELPLSITILYFDQSSSQLRPGVRQTLDTIAQYLVRQSNMLATITAYTDPVGKRELNMALAKQRALVVKNYLLQHNVRASQIMENWEGPDMEATAESGAIKTILRRVIVQLSPR